MTGLPRLNKRLSENNNLEAKQAQLHKRTNNKLGHLPTIWHGGRGGYHPTVATTISHKPTRNASKITRTFIAKRANW